MKGFTEEGDFVGKILEAELVVSKFHKDDPNAFDVALTIQTEDGRGGYWIGQCSDEYGVGNSAGLKQYEITSENLAKIGYRHGNDFTRISELVGKQINFKVVGKEYKGRIYYEIKYIGGGGYTPQKLSMDEVKRRMAALGIGKNQIDEDIPF